LGGVVQLGESGLGGTKATEKPMCKESDQEKGRFQRGDRIRGLWHRAEATENPMCKESRKEKG